MKNYFFILLSAFFLQFCVHSKNCNKCFGNSEDTKKIYVSHYTLEVPNSYDIVDMMPLLMGKNTVGEIRCSVCKKNYIYFDYGLWGWGDFPESEENYIRYGDWYAHKSLENTKFKVLKANDSIKKIYPSADYYAIDSISGNTHPIQIPKEVKNYQFIYRDDDSFKLKIAYSIASEKDKKYRIWLEAMPSPSLSRNYNKLYLYYACRTTKERDFVIEMYKTIKMKE